MAQLLENFENTIEPHVDPVKARAFKADIRKKINDFTTDCQLIVDMVRKGEEVNGFAVHQRDRLQ